MRITLLGTGSADGWPNPYCDCTSCSAARREGAVRGQTAALVDDVLLLDCGPETPRAAERYADGLHRVRLLVLGHSHADHAGRAPLLWRSWAAGAGPLEVAGPPEALAAAADWLPREPTGDAPLLTPLAAGDVLERFGYRVRALAAAHGEPWSGPALLTDVTGPDGGRLLYATDTGPLPAATVAACAGAAYDVVLLEETFGDRTRPPGDTDEPADHLDLRSFPEQLARLRAVGAVTPGTRVVAVHLSHHNPPPRELALRLAACGATAPPDGTVLRTEERAGAATRRVLVTGGVRSGKSAWAEAEVAGWGTVTYAATGPDHTHDAEWTARVAEHRRRRPPHWRTVVVAGHADLVTLLADAGPQDALLVDDLGNWLTAAADAGGWWDAAAAADPATGATAALAGAVRACRAGLLVLVTNEVGDGVVPAHPAGRRFRDWLGRANRAVAGACDEVVLVTVGIPQHLKKGTP